MNDNALTQKGIAENLTESGLARSQGLILKKLAQLTITRKQLSLVPQERNNPRILEVRHNYAREMSNIEIYKLVYLDETGFNLHTTQNYGYSAKNIKAYVTIPANRGKNISLMAAISIDGIIAYNLHDGAYNGDAFLEFIRI